MTQPIDPPSQVTLVKDNGRRRQWALGPFFRQEGRKVTAVPKAFGLLALAIFVIGALTSLFSSDWDLALAPVKGRFGIDGLVEASAKLLNVPPAAAGSEAPRPKVGGGGRSAKPAAFGKLAVIGRADASSIPPGSLFKARLVSGAATGPLRAEVLEPLTVAGGTRIEAGTVLLGNGQASVDRLAIRFSRLVFKDGSSQEIEAQALDLSDQTVGLKGSKVGGYGLKLAAATALNFAGGVSEGLQDSKASFGATVRPPTPRNALLNGAATAALSEGTNLMTEAKDATVVVAVPAGTIFLVLVGQGG